MLMFDVLICKNENVSKCIQVTISITVENLPPVDLFKFVMYKMLFCKCRCEMCCMTRIDTNCDVTMGR